MSKLLLVLCFLTFFGFNVNAQQAWIGKFKENGGNGLAGEIVNSRHLKHLDLHRFEFKNTEVAEKLLSSGRFEFLEPDEEISISAIPNDTFISSQWAITNIEADLGWDISTGSDEIVVAVVDTGIWTQHSDLTNNLWKDPLSGASGWTARGGVLTEGVTDDHGHGTHVAGIIGATGNNNKGVAGLNWKVKLAGFKFIGSSGTGSRGDAFLCLDKIIELKKRGINIRVVNNSWGSTSKDYTLSLAAAFKKLEENNILAVNAAGNESQNGDINSFMPANLTNNNVISVMASTPFNKKASFSNFGYTSVDIAAPGSSILSTVPQIKAALGTSTGYKMASGTSMAAPHVAGLAALVLSLNPYLTVDQVKEVILNNASYDLMDSPTKSQTGGKINVKKTLSNPLVYRPEKNHSPVLFVKYPTNVVGGQRITIYASAIDPDGDPVKIIISPLDTLFREKTSTNAAGTNVSFLSPKYVIDYVCKARIIALDNNGSSAEQYININILKNGIYAPTFGLETVVINNPTNSLHPIARACLTEGSIIPQKLTYGYLFGLNGGVQANTSFFGTLTNCASKTATYANGISNKSIVVYTIAETPKKELVYSPYTYFRVGTETSSTTQAPIIDLKLSAQSGYGPLNIAFDFSGCKDLYGPVTFIIDKESNGQRVYIPEKGTLTYPNVGTFKSRLTVQGKYFSVSAWFYVTVLTQ